MPLYNCCRLFSHLFLKNVMSVFKYREYLYSQTKGIYLLSDILFETFYMPEYGDLFLNQFFKLGEHRDHF